ncbi:MAG TPA: MATE family efflux transporter [Vicinamibacterales bacterium]|nr:MATE family efflux transporter [Vicinamibacterales bacterium]
MQDLTTGSVVRHLLKTASFMLVTMVFQTLYSLVDLYWVGRLGKEAVAAVGISGNLSFVVLAISQMLGVGTTTLVSHAAGRRDKPQALLVFNQSLVLSSLAGVIFFVLAMALRTTYAEKVAADALTADLASDYLLWFIPAMALQFGIVAMSAALRGTGNFKPGMVVQSSTVVLNMVLAPFLIFGWGTGHPLGVAGAAISTLVAVAVGSVWLTLYFLPEDSFLRFVPADARPQIGLWGRILKIGLPAGAEFGMTTIYMLLVYIVTRPFGAAAQAGFGVGLRIVLAGYLPVVALGFSVAPVAGQNFGARRPERVRQTFLMGAALSAVLMAAFAVLCHIAPAAMVRIFSQDPQVVSVGEEYLRVISWGFVATGVVFVASSTFQAMGNTLPSLATSFLRVLIVAIPVMLLSRQPGFELRWIWYLSVGAVLLQVVASLWLLWREFELRLTSMEPA